MQQGAFRDQSGIEPLPPEGARFDAVSNRWILSRYSEVYAALGNPGLVLSSADDRAVVEDSSLHAMVHADLASITSAEWQSQMRGAASALIHRIAADYPFDLVKEMILPWSVSAMLKLNEAQAAAITSLPQAHARRLTDVAGRLFYKTWQPRDPSIPGSLLQAVCNKWFASRGATAMHQLDRLLERGDLARSWLALLRNPDQQAGLLAAPVDKWRLLCDRGANEHRKNTLCAERPTRECTIT